MTGKPGPSGRLLPMLATTGPVPVGADWAFEFKWDGQRALAEIRGRRLCLYSRTGREITAVFPDLRPLADQCAGRHGRPVALLDGEIVAPDAAGVPSFDLLRRRMNARDPDATVVRAVPVRFYAFDVLAWLGRDTTGLGYRERRRLLDEMDLTGAAGYAPPYFCGSGADVLDAARESGLAGVVGKRLDSCYRPGRRSRDWVTTPLAPTRPVIIAGWRPGQGRLSGGVGALVLAGHDRHGRLCWLGNVGTGFPAQARNDLAARLAVLARDTSPLYRAPPAACGRDIRWVSPRLVGEVMYRALNAEGRLRHVVWRGLRFDLPTEAVAYELPG